MIRHTGDKIGDMSRSIGRVGAAELGIRNEARMLIIELKKLTQNFSHRRIGALHTGDKNDLLINEPVELSLQRIDFRTETNQFLLKKMQPSESRRKSLHLFQRLSNNIAHQQVDQTIDQLIAIE